MLLFELENLKKSKQICNKTPKYARTDWQSPIINYRLRQSEMIILNNLVRLSEPIIWTLYCMTMVLIKVVHLVVP